MNSHQNVKLKPVNVIKSRNRMTKVNMPKDVTEKDSKVSPEPNAHLRLALGSWQSWEVISISRPNIASTTARVVVILMKTRPVYKPLTSATLISVVHSALWSSCKVQKCQSPNIFVSANSQWPSHTEMEDRTIAIAMQRIVRLLTNTSSIDRPVFPHWRPWTLSKYSFSLLKNIFTFAAALWSCVPPLVCNRGAAFMFGGGKTTRARREVSPL